MVMKLIAITIIFVLTRNK